MVSRVRLIGLVLAVGAIAAGCAATQRQIRSDALEFLYPAGTTGIPASDVTLKPPIRVGVAFAPASASRAETFTEDERQNLLAKIVEAFRGREGIASVQPIPTTYLQPGGGFANIDRVAATFGFDVVALISYDQVQFSESGTASIAYWTIIGAYVVRGEKNETRTMLDAAVFDVASRALLFNASGRSGVMGKATPVGIERKLRERSREGFDAAMTDLVANLDTALAAFQEQIKTGTVRGPGTAAVTLADASGNPLPPGSGGGSHGALAWCLAGLVAAGARLAWRRSGR